MAKTFLILAALSGFLAVAAGAFGAHALKTRLSPEHFNVFEVGARYHMYHSLGLLAVSILAAQTANAWIAPAGWTFFFGNIVFAGSLYAYALTGIRTWGAVTPIGGLLYLAGWFFLLLAALRR